MIEYDIVSYLKSDATLDALLSSTASDSKIYPVQGKWSTVPYIIYEITQQGTTDENLKEITVTFTVVTDTYSTGKTIRDRLYDLLDIQDSLRSVITANNYYYYWSKLVTGRQYKDSTDNNYYRFELDFNMKYNEL